MCLNVDTAWDGFKFIFHLVSDTLATIKEIRLN